MADNTFNLSPCATAYVNNHSYIEDKSLIDSSGSHKKSRRRFYDLLRAKAICIQSARYFLAKQMHD